MKTEFMIVKNTVDQFIENYKIAINIKERNKTTRYALEFITMTNYPILAEHYFRGIREYERTKPMGQH